MEIFHSVSNITLSLTFLINLQLFNSYEKYMESGKTLHAVAGYTTVYEYYAFPSNKRPRISQMLVLPPFQRLGLGAEMLQTIYNNYLRDKSVVDITGEFFLLYSISCH